MSRVFSPWPALWSMMIGFFVLRLRYLVRCCDLQVRLSVVSVLSA